MSYHNDNSGGVAIQSIPGQYGALVFFTTVSTGDTVIIGRQPFQGWCCCIDLFPG